MKLTKKQKGYVAVLVVALAAFLADRLLFPPAAADADVLENPSDLLIKPVGGVAKAAPAPQRNPYRVDLLAERLTVAASEHRLELSNVRDAFVPSAAWVSGPKVIMHDNAAESAAAFRDKYKLTAILVGSNGATAIINGRSVKVGQRLGGFTLKSIGNRSTTFAAGENRVELLLDPEASVKAE
jgi:hypothetical protein